MSHRLVVIYPDFDPSLDAKIDKIVGRQSGASGYGFGERDLCYYFDRAYKGKTTKQCATEALKKLNKAKFHGVHAEVFEAEDYD